MARSELILIFCFKVQDPTLVVNLYLLFYFRGEDSLKEYLEVKTVTIKMPYKI
jgi:hypothetical protein